MDQVDDEHPELGRKENSLKWPHMERVTRITKSYFNEDPQKLRGEREFQYQYLGKREENENVF